MLDLQKKLSVERQLVAVRTQYIKKLEELVAIENKIASMSKAANAAVKKPSQPASKPTQSKPAHASSAPKRNEPIPMPGKPISLPVLVQKILSDSKKSLTHVEVAELAIRNGYKTSSKDFPTNVYQALNKLVNKKSIKQDKSPDGKVHFSAA